MNSAENRTNFKNLLEHKLVKTQENKTLYTMF